MRIEIGREDLDELRRRVAAERDAMQRDRYRAVLLAGGGGGGGGGGGEAGPAARRPTRARVAAAVGRCPRLVDEWVGRYRRGGLAGLAARKPKGGTPRP